MVTAMAFSRALLIPFACTIRDSLLWDMILTQHGTGALCRYERYGGFGKVLLWDYGVHYLAVYMYKTCIQGRDRQMTLITIA
jgi:hypothetical protein